MIFGIKEQLLQSRESIISSAKVQTTFAYSQQQLEQFLGIISTRGIVALCGEGYSQLITTYIEMKLNARGYPTVNKRSLEPDQMAQALADIATLLIVVSKSGHTGACVEIAREFRERNVAVAVFTGRRTSPLSSLADILFVIDDDAPFDRAERGPSSFTGCCILAFERPLTMLDTSRNGNAGA